MATLWNNYRYLFFRRLTQISLLVLYFGANAWGWNILMGNLSSSLFLNFVPMSDPYAALQMLAAGAVIAVDLLIGAVVVTLFYMIIGGRAFCSWVCPINMITDAASLVRRVIGMNKITGIKQPASRNMRYWILALSLVISFIMGITAFEFISPISMVH
jgi:ferredoxin-type protein NapH